MSPTGSIVDTLDEGIRQAYRSGDTDAILTAIQNVDRESAARTAESRYHEYFEDVEEELYVLAGNQDFPAVLRTVASDYSNIHHADELSWSVAIDGVVPEYSGLPEGVFPGECSRSEFESAVQAKDGLVFLAHQLPDGFRPSKWGFELAITAHHDEETRTEGDVIYLGPYLRTDDGINIVVKPETSEVEYSLST